MGAGLVLWQLILVFQTARSGRRLTLEFAAFKTHYIQAVLHLSIFAYWGYYWRNVYAEAHLIAAQIVFLYVFDMLLCWSRRDHWRLGQPTVLHSMPRLALMYFTTRCVSRGN